MTRHQKNSTANTVYTYHERRKDARESGYGSLEQRLSKDSIKGFDCCCLTLQPCVDPVVSPDGYLFDKAAILEYVINCKQDNKRKLKLWEQQQLEKQQEQQQSDELQRQKLLKRFISQQATPTVNRLGDDDDDIPGSSSSMMAELAPSVSNMAGHKRKQLPSFWVPDQLPAAKKSRIEEAPDQKVYCPVSGKLLKVKELIDVKFVEVPEQQRSSSDKEKYWCAVTHDLLTQSTELAVLRNSGLVVTSDCVKNLIKPKMQDPFTGEPLTEKDIITLQRGGTGFASTNVKLVAKMHRPNIELQ